MASAEEVAQLRLLIAEGTPEKYDDAQLSDILDNAQGDQNQAAYEIWVQKAASAAELVDVSEGGSSRKMGDIYEQALTMANFFGAKVPGGVTPEAPKYTRLQKLARP